MPNADTMELPFGVFVILRELIRERIGFAFEDDKRELLALKLADRVAVLELASYLDYYYLLKYGPGAEAEWPRLTDALSVQETYFWREIDQIQTLVDVLVPQHVAAGRGLVRIWCAACATGEEPLTIAMALNEAGWFERVEVEIRASDVSEAALEKARAGVYRERAFRSLPGSYRAKYFTPHPRGWEVAPELRNRIQYSQANLLETAEIRNLADVSFVFCRNVFIYFATRTVERVVKTFSDSMRTPSHLFVGASESLLRMKTDFALQEIGGTFLYVRDSSGGPS